MPSSSRGIAPYHIVKKAVLCITAFWPTRLPQRVKPGNALLEQMFSGSPPKADVPADADLRRFVPRGDLSKCSNVREQSCGYSITASARAITVAGISRPSAFAVRGLEVNDQLDFVGACTGRSAGFSPFRMRSI